MIDTPTVRTILGLLLIVSGMAVPGGTVVAQEKGSQGEVPDRRVLLDADTKQLGSVDQSGSTFRVYRVENTLPYASGIEVYRNGQRVEDADQVRAVLRVVAWRRAARDIGPQDIEKFRAIRQQSDRIERIVTPPLQFLNTVLGVVDELKSAKVGPISAWDLAVKQAPALKDFVTVATELRNELQKWKSASAKTSSNAQEVITGLQRVKDGQKVDYGQLSNSFRGTMSGIEELSTQSEQVQEKLSTLGGMSATIAREGGQVRVVGDMIRNNFGELARILEQTTNNIEEFQSLLEDRRQKLSSVQSTAQSQHNQLMGDWRAREQAKVRVFGSIGSPVLFLIGGALLYSRRSTDDVPTRHTNKDQSRQRAASPDDRSHLSKSDDNGPLLNDRPSSEQLGGRKSNRPPEASSVNSGPGGRNPEELEPRFCRGCGSRIEQQWNRCPECGEQI